MTLFSFDKFWGLEWTRIGNSNLYYSEKGDFKLYVDRTKSSACLFSIARMDAKKGEYLAERLNTDLFIMQLKSIEETKKILKYDTKG